MLYLQIINGRGAPRQKYSPLKGLSQDLCGAERGRRRGFTEAKGNAGTSDNICCTVATRLRRAIVHRAALKDFVRQKGMIASH